MSRQRLVAAPGASRRTKNYLKRRKVQVLKHRHNYVLLGEHDRPLAWVPTDEVLIQGASVKDHG